MGDKRIAVIADTGEMIIATIKPIEVTIIISKIVTIVSDVIPLIYCMSAQKIFEIIPGALSFLSYHWICL